MYVRKKFKEVSADLYLSGSLFLSSGALTATAVTPSDFSCPSAKLKDVSLRISGSVLGHMQLNVQIKHDSEMTTKSFKSQWHDVFSFLNSKTMEKRQKGLSAS